MKKNKYGEENVGLGPEILKIVLASAIVLGAFIGAHKITDNYFQQELARQFPVEVEK